jgi:hypothetical protein
VDYGKQELSASWLIFAQICHAIVLQKKGGMFVLKMFDIFHNISIDFLYLLSIYYESVSIYKPLTSREANSERYIVCRGFKDQVVHLVETEAILTRFVEILNKGREIGYIEIPKGILLRSPPLSFVNSIEEANIMLAQRQIQNIEATLNLIVGSGGGAGAGSGGSGAISSKSQNSRIETIRKQNIQKCVQWCIKHKLPYNHFSAFVHPRNKTFKYRPAKPLHSIGEDIVSPIEIVPEPIIIPLGDDTETPLT